MARLMVTDESRRRRRKLSDDEHALWRQVTRSVAPLKRLRAKADAEEAEPDQRTKTQAPPKAKRAAEAAPVRAPATLHPRPLAPIERRQKKRLARGTLP